MGCNFQMLIRLFCYRQIWGSMSMWSCSIVALSPSKWDATFTCWPDPLCSRQSWGPKSMWIHSIVALSPSKWDATYTCWPDSFCSRQRWGPMPKDLTRWVTTCEQKGCGKWGWAKVRAKHPGPRPQKAARRQWQASRGNATTTATRKRNWGGCTQSMTDIDWFQPQGWRVDSRKELGWAD